MPISKRASPSSSLPPPPASPQLSRKPFSPSSMSSTTSSTSPTPPLISSSSSSSTVKVSSPLNPSSPPTRTPPLPTIPAPTPPSRPDSPTLLGNSDISGRRRGASLSTIRSDVPQLIAATQSLPVSSAATSESASPAESTSSLPIPLHGFKPRGRYHSTPSRSTSPRRPSPVDHSPIRHDGKGRETPPNGVPTTWWGSREPQARPWPWDETMLSKQRRESLSGGSSPMRSHEREVSPARSVGSTSMAVINERGSGWRELWSERKEKKTIPEEQMEGWVHTRQKIAQALSTTLDTALDVTHEALVLSADLLKLAPVVGLEEAARTLLNIWDAVQMVDMNRLACLRLTERCAEILISIRDEILETGENKVAKELESAVERLVAAFTQVHNLLLKQAHRPFLKRYLKRDEIQREIAGCGQALADALGLFSLSIQIRTLKQILRAEQQREADMAAITASLERLEVSSRGRTPVITGAPVPQAIANALQLDRTPHELASAHTTPLHILTTLRTLQNERDTLRDAADLRQLMRGALQTNNDVEMIKVLQVGRDEMPEAIKTLQRALEIVVEKERVEEEASAFAGATIEPSSTSGLSRSSTISSSGSSTAMGRRSRASRDTLDREFIESGIESLRRLSLSRGTDLTLPSWTITRYEVDREEKVGIGFFSDVYRGRWRDSVVAIKVLAEATPRPLFIHEVKIWRTLKHPNVLELLGASSTSGDPPWFFVSPYYKNGSLIRYLKALDSLDGVDILRMIHQIAKGMAYLHGKGVLHGDLKGANILVDDRGHCVISDFGQSELKSEVYRLSGTPLPHGTLRWQSPELMAGQSKLTQQVDVYAFAICCVEILTKGALPWPMADDDAVRHFVLKNMRPAIPLQPVWNMELAEILRQCWHRSPVHRPSFAKIDAEIQQLRTKYSGDFRDTPLASTLDLEYDPLKRKSPPMHPIPLPILPPDTTASIVNEHSPSFTDDSYQTATDQLSMIREDASSHIGSTTQGQHSHHHSPVKSRSSSLFIHTPSTESEYEFHHEHVAESGYQSPPPVDDNIAEARNERRYRMLLQHEFHPSLTLPLWSPTVVGLGSVGYHCKPKGTFVTLFNSFKPPETSDGVAEGVPSLYGYGRVIQGSQRIDKRNVAQRGMDILQSWITSRSKGDGMFPQSVSRRYSSPIRTGHKAAHLFTESTVYRYIEDLGTPKAWFKANVDHILELYGAGHGIQKEDLYLVIGTLDAADYALFVSHNHPDGEVNFNVYSSPKAGKPWGQFSTSTDLSPSVLGGPVYTEEAPGYQSANKVSIVRSSGKWDTVLLAKLRFPPDKSEPTSL
ncbi:unnamed protein product [Somion occarium]|uniref:Protein kinase domain-containing protein n=1 Tax=Somion occarium TaxID=3059160 RepID=A0ABP1CS83_9APHY